MKLDITNIILSLLGVMLVLCFILILTDKQQENFDPVMDAIQTQIKTENPEQLKQTIQSLQQRLIDYGYAPDLKNYVKKTELDINSGKCLVSGAEDRDKYISKADSPMPGPRIDLSQYVKKSSIPPEKVCPPQPSVDLSAYVKKSTLPPNEKCPPCISPKVKVSAGLCRECPPAPPCPAPEPCPAYNCPPPEPCLQAKECRKCDDIRYIKVPTIITKTITVDQNGNVVSQKVDSSTTTTVPMPTPTPTPSQTLMPTQTQTLMPTQIPTLTHMLYSNNQTEQKNQIPSTTFPTIAYTQNNTTTTLAQTLSDDQTNDFNTSFCPSSNLNSKFSEYSNISANINQNARGRYI